MIDFSKFEDRIGIVFKNKDLLKQAFIHRSYLNENPKVKMSHNERLEFLGDAVLELTVTDYLYKKYPEKAEGDLTSYRAAMVNTTSISKAASSLGMNDFLLLSKGEAKDNGRARQYILADTYESVIGAIYLDQGYKVASEFIKDSLFDYLDEILDKGLWKDAKSFLQEQAQEKLSITPNYDVLEQVGPDHDKHFTIGVYLGEELIAKGEGKSKQSAEQEAAAAALKIKGWEDLKK